jgi:hypothetical protein
MAPTDGVLSTLNPIARALAAQVSPLPKVPAVPLGPVMWLLKLTPSWFIRHATKEVHSL